MPSRVERATALRAATATREARTENADATRRVAWRAPPRTRRRRGRCRRRPLRVSTANDARARGRRRAMASDVGGTRRGRGRWCADWSSRARCRRCEGSTRGGRRRRRRRRRRIVMAFGKGVARLPADRRRTRRRGRSPHQRHTAGELVRTRMKDKHESCVAIHRS